MLLIFSASDFRSICDRLASSETIFQRIIQCYGYPPVWTRPANFSTLVYIILEQQVSLASAKAAFEKLSNYVGQITPAALLALSDEEMKACYFSRQKMGYARHLSEMVARGQLDIDALHQQSDEEVRHQLQQVKGIGSWTSDVFLMMALQRSDCFPIGDIALANSMRYEMQLPATTSTQHLMVIAENWRPFRTVAAYILWHAYLSKKKKN